MYLDHIYLTCTFLEEAFNREMHKSGWSWQFSVDVFLVKRWTLKEVLGYQLWETEFCDRISMKCCRKLKCRIRWNSTLSNTFHVKACHSIFSDKKNVNVLVFFPHQSDKIRQIFIPCLNKVWFFVWLVNNTEKEPKFGDWCSLGPRCLSTLEGNLANV